jgi:hypothetical protein
MSFALSLKSLFGNFIGKTLLRFFVITLILAYGFSIVTEYDNLKPIVSDFSAKLVDINLPLIDNIQQQGTNQNLGEQLTGSIVEYCKTNDEFHIPGYEGSPIDCKEVRGKGISSAQELITNALMKDYYKEYDCSAIGCLANIFFNRRPGDMIFILSVKMNSFIKLLIPFLVVGVLLSLSIMIFSIKEKFLLFKEVGMTLLSSAGIPFLILLLLLYKDKILVSTGILSGKEDFMRTTTDFFSGAILNVVNLYLYLYGAVFIVGSILAIIGYYGILKKSKTSQIPQ